MPRPGLKRSPGSAAASLRHDDAGSSVAVRGTSRRAPWRRVLGYAAVALLGAVAYSNSFGVPFVFDDVKGIAGNEALKDLGRLLRSAAALPTLSNRYVGEVTLALNHALGGVNVAGYHAVNLAIHLLAGGLVLALVEHLFRTPRLRTSALAPWSSPLGTIAALLFVSHPLQTQAVTYVVQRYASLATLLYLAAVVLFLQWRLARDAGARAAGRYVLLLAAIVLAMKTKETAFTVPVVLLLCELSFFEAPWRRRWPFLAPILATLAIIPLTLALGGGDGGLTAHLDAATRVQTTLSRLDYFRTQLVVVPRYLALLVAPVGQNLDHDVAVPGSFLEPTVVLSATLLASLVVAAAILHRGRTLTRPPTALDPATRLVSFGIGWFFVTLAPESSFVPIVDVMFEHRVYLPSVGASIAAVGAAALVARRLAPTGGLRAVVTGGIAVSLVLTAATYRRNEVWQSELALWSDAAAKSPRKWRPQYNVGRAYDLAGRTAEAAAAYLEAIRLAPDEADPHHNLGVLELRRGNPAAAVAQLEAALRLDPTHPDVASVHFNLGVARAALGRPDEALRDYGRALASNPRYEPAHVNLGVAYAEAGDLERAAEHFEAALRLRPEDTEARLDLAVAYAKLGRPAAAAAAAREVLALEPGNGAALEVLRRLQGAGAPNR